MLLVHLLRMYLFLPGTVIWPLSRLLFSTVPPGSQPILAAAMRRSRSARPSSSSSYPAFRRLRLPCPCPPYRRREPDGAFSTSPAACLFPLSPRKRLLPQILLSLTEGIPGCLGLTFQGPTCFSSSDRMSLTRIRLACSSSSFFWAMFFLRLEFNNTGSPFVEAPRPLFGFPLKIHQSVPVR